LSEGDVLFLTHSFGVNP